MRGKIKLLLTLEYQTDEPMTTDEVEYLVSNSVKVPIRVASPKVDGTIRLTLITTEVKR